VTGHLEPILPTAGTAHGLVHGYEEPSTTEKLWATGLGRDPVTDEDGSSEEEEDELQDNSASRNARRPIFLKRNLEDA
jgi:hypothetical protein